MEHLAWIVPTLCIVAFVCSKYANFALNNKRKDDDKYGKIAQYIKEFIMFILKRDNKKG